MNNVEKYLQEKFECESNEVQKMLYDLVSDQRNWLMVCNLFEDYKNQSDDTTDTKIKDLNSFNAYLIKVAEAKVGYRFKLNQLKRLINALL